jgi:predicted CopG family antitoxin
MSKSEITTIQIERSVLNELKRVKRYPRETYSETILNLIKNAEETKEFGTFVQQAQEERIKKLWEEGDYFGWEHA